MKFFFIFLFFSSFVDSSCEKLINKMSLLNKTDSTFIKENNLDFKVYFLQKKKRISSLRKNYTWERLGLYLRISSEESKNIANSLFYYEPYCFILFLRSDELSSFKKDSILKELKLKLKNDKKNIGDLSNSNLLKYSYNTNPLLKKKLDAIHIDKKLSINKVDNKINTTLTESSSKLKLIIYIINFNLLLICVLYIYLIYKSYNLIDFFIVLIPIIGAIYIIRKIINKK